MKTRRRIQPHETNVFLAESFFRLTVLNYRCSLIGYGQIKSA